MTESALLPERLRHATRGLHAAAERSALMAALIDGRLPRGRYVALLRSLHALYEALEAALDDHAADPALALLPREQLRRAPALAADLERLHGPGWRHALAPAPAAADYAQRLHALAGARPRTLAAHAYVRYLGDLYGGQVLARRAARSTGDDVATRFYDFGADADLKALRAAVRAMLAALPAADADGVVTEAGWAFQQHRRLFQQLV